MSNSTVLGSFHGLHYTREEAASETMCIRTIVKQRHVVLSKKSREQRVRKARHRVIDAARVVSLEFRPTSPSAIALKLQWSFSCSRFDLLAEFPQEGNEISIRSGNSTAMFFRSPLTCHPFHSLTPNFEVARVNLGLVTVDRSGWTNSPLIYKKLSTWSFMRSQIKSIVWSEL